MMTIPGMQAAIKSAFISVLGTPAVEADLDKFCLAMATGLVPYLTANVVVEPGTFTAPSGGGPITGMGTIE